MRFFQLHSVVLALGLLGTAGLMVTNLSPAAYGQTIVSGDVTGRVTDTSGAIVVDATVTLRNSAEGVSRSGNTNSDGVYRFSLLPPGNYTIKVVSAGLAGAATHVEVSVGKASTINIIVKPATVATQVVVDSSSEPMLETENANITTVLSARAIEQLPIPGGDISTLAFTAPGVNLSTGAGYGGFVAFGMPADANMYTLNGNDIMDPYNSLNNSGSSNLTLGENEIADVAMVNNGYTAQYGRYPGTQINYTTKSGGNDFHGALQYFWNGRVMNANDWVNKNGGGDRPFANSNEWAGSVGGPLWHNKLFFYFDTEGARYVLAAGGTTYIPTEEFMSDVLANVSNLNPVEAAYYKRIQSLYSGANGAKNATTLSNDPFTVGTKPSNYSVSDCGQLDGYLAGTAPAGTASQNLVNGHAYGYTYTSYTTDADGKIYPATATTGLPCTRQFYAANNNLNTEALWSARLDHVMGANDHASYRVRHDWGSQPTYTDPLNAAFNALSVQPEWEGQFNEIHTFNSHVTNNLILSGLWYSSVFGPKSMAASTAVFPTTIEFGDGDGFAAVGGENYRYMQGRNVQQEQVVDDLSVLLGKHSLKFGLNFRANKISDFSGERNLYGQTTFNSLADFANGEITQDGGSAVTKNFSSVTEVPISMKTFGIYAQDEWAATDKLKLTLSLRFDRSGNIKCLNNCFSRLASTFSEISHEASTPYNTSIKAGLGNAFQDTDLFTIQPRVGFSYAPFGQTGRYVFRGGVGMFSDATPGLIADYFLTNAPNVLTFNYTQPDSGYSYVDPTITSNSAYSNMSAAANAFTSGFSSGQTMAQIKAATVAAGGVYTAPSFTSVVNKMKTPKYLEWNFEGQMQLSHSDVLDVNYVGNHAWDTFMLNNMDNAYSPYGMAGLSTTAPDSRFGMVTNLTNEGRANYNGLTTSIRHIAKFGLTLTGNYTYSHTLDRVSNGGLQGFNLVATSYTNYPLSQITAGNSKDLNYGNADYDIRHSSSVQYVWTIPYKSNNKFINPVITGWAVSGNIFYRGGYPLSITNSKINSSQLGNQLTTAAGRQMLASMTGGKDFNCAKKPGSDMSAQACFTSDTFASVKSGVLYSYGFGNLARNSFRGPHYFNTDLQLNKETTLREKYTVKVGANFFNLLNHANFAGPVTNAAAANFGEFYSTVTPPSSPYGSFMGSAVSGRVVQLLTSFTF